MQDLGEIVQPCFLNLDWGYQHSVSESQGLCVSVGKNSMVNYSMVPISWSQRSPEKLCSAGHFLSFYVQFETYCLQLVWILENTLVMQHMEKVWKVFLIPPFHSNICRVHFFFFLLRSLQSFGVCSCFFGGGSSVKAIMLLDSFVRCQIENIR